MQKKNKLGVLIIGPIFKSKSGLTGQGGKLYQHLSKLNYRVNVVSSYRNKVLRMLDTLFTLVIKKNQYDIILLQSFGLLAFILEDVVSLTANLFSKPIVFNLHGGGLHEFYLKYPKWTIRVFKRANLIQSPSLFLSAFFNNLGLNVQYTPNFIEIDKFPYLREDNDFSILWVRAFHETYHPELAIETLKVLKTQYPDVKLTMVGPDMGLLTKCKLLIKKYSLDNNVNIAGYIPNSELHKYYHSHQVFITTTRYESFGVAILESAACGIPGVSVSVGEIPYIWKDRENILLVERNPEDFALKISELFNKKELRDYISANARKNAEKYIWDNVEPLWLNTISKLTKKD